MSSFRQLDVREMALVEGGLSWSSVTSFVKNAAQWVAQFIKDVRAFANAGKAVLANLGLKL